MEHVGFEDYASLWRVWMVGPQRGPFNAELRNIPYRRLTLSTRQYIVLSIFEITEADNFLVSNNINHVQSGYHGHIRAEDSFAGLGRRNEGTAILSQGSHLLLSFN